MTQVSVFLAVSSRNITLALREQITLSLQHLGSILQSWSFSNGTHCIPIELLCKNDTSINEIHPLMPSFLATVIQKADQLPLVPFFWWARNCIPIVPTFGPIRI